MVVVRTEQHVYPYGTFYDINGADLSADRNGYDVIVYVKITGQNRAIGSLEGVFVCSEAIRRAAPLCRREQMPEFEKKYKGKFVPFD